MLTRFSMLAASAASALICAMPAQAQTDAYVAQVIETGGNFCPSGTMQASGQILPVAQYQMLFSLLGARFGGDGRTTFSLPTLQPNTPPQGKAMLYCIVTQGLYPHRP